MTSPRTTVTVIGAGSWGTALAQHLAANGRQTVLWGRDPQILNTIEKHHASPAYLPDVALCPAIDVRSNLADAVAAAEWLVLAVPCSAMRAIASEVAAAISPETRGVIWTCKGIEFDTGLLMHEVLEQTMGAVVPMACLSGPSFASEVARGKPTAVVLAAPDIGFAESAAAVFHTEAFRVYANRDMVGAEVAGALKNVIAIAAGICDGLGLGDNARAALVTRGLAEVSRLTEAMGGTAQTMSGLAGMGDMVLTCLTDQSRNRQYGLSLAAHGAHKPTGTVEGIATARTVGALAKRHAVDMPICSAVARVLRGEVSPSEAAEGLLGREMKREV